MPNYKIISSTPEPLYVQSTTAINTAAANGRVFSVTTGDQSIPGSGFLAVQLTIPANSEKTIYIVRVAGGSLSNAVIDTYRNATFSGGTNITPYNENWGFSGGSACTCKFLINSTDPTTGGQNISTIVANGLVLASYEGRLIIPSSSSDRQFYLVLRNKSSSTNIAAATIGYMELP